MATCPHCEAAVTDSAAVCGVCNKPIDGPSPIALAASASEVAWTAEREPGALYCQHCGAVARPITQVKGSFAIELVLWLCFLVPGVFYSVWRLTTKAQVCPTCHAPHMIPLDSPKASAALLVSPQTRRREAPVTAIAPDASARPATPKAKRPWVARPHADSVKLTALPISDDASQCDLGCGKDFSVAVVGESRRQAALHGLDNGRLRRGINVTFIAALIPEPENSFDPNAIAVRILGGAPVGYLDRDDALRYRPVFEVLASQRRTGVARAKLIGGTEAKPSIGVMLDINLPEDLLATLDEQPF